VLFRSSPRSPRASRRCGTASAGPTCSTAAFPTPCSWSASPAKVWAPWWCPEDGGPQALHLQRRSERAGVARPHRDEPLALSQGRVMSFDELAALDAAHVMQTYARLPVAFVRGEGTRLWDSE